MKRKMISAVIIAVMLIVQLIPVSAAASYDTAALDNAISQLQGLKANNYPALVAILSNAMVYAKAEQTDGAPVTEAAVDRVYAGVKGAVDSTLWATVVNESGTPVTGKIESANLKLIIKKVIERRAIIDNLYNRFATTYKTILNENRPVIAAVLGLSTSASNAEIYMGMLGKAGKVVTLSNGQFARYGDAAHNVIVNIGLTDAIANVVLPNYNTTVNAEIDTYAAELNQYASDSQIPIPQAEIIKALNIFGLYQAPATPPSGGVIIIPPTVPVEEKPDTTNVITPPSAPIPDEAAALVDTLLDGAESINNEADPDKALDTATGLISEAAGQIASLESSGVSTQAVAEVLQQVANAVLSKVNTQTVEATTSDGKLSTVIDTAAAKELIAKLDTIKTTTSELNTALENASADIKIESVLNIEMKSSASDAAKASIQLDASLLAAAEDKDIDKIAINTGLATITIAPDAVKNTAAEPLSFSVEKIAAANLTETQKQAAGSSQVFEFKAFAGDNDITTFNKPVEISIPYSLKAGESADTITVFYINTKGELKNVAAIYDPVLKVAKFLTNHFSKYMVKNNIINFSDLGSAAWARSSIEFIAAKGITEGVGGNKFNPSDKLTRAQLVAMIVRAFSLEDASAENKFTDVATTNWYYSAVVSAAKAGIISGTSKDKFEPNAYVTRQDMATIIARALTAVKGKSITDASDNYIGKFTDKSEISNYAVKTVNLTVKYGIISGMTGGRFAPKGLATRAEAAAVLYRMINVK